MVVGYLSMLKKVCFAICFSIYRPPEYSNLTIFFDEITTTLSKALLKYENIILMEGFNIDTKCNGMRTDKLEELCDAFNLKNLVKSETCFTKDNKYPNKQTFIISKNSRNYNGFE